MSKELIAPFREVLWMLASAPEAQTEYLRNLGVAPLADELALELADVFPVVRNTLPPEPASQVPTQLITEDI